MFSQLTRTLKRIVKSPYMDIVVGLVFLYSGVSETLEELRELDSVTLGAHHGAIVFAALYIVRAIPDVVKGVEHLAKGRGGDAD